MTPTDDGLDDQRTQHTIRLQEIGEELRARRKKLGLTQAEMAKNAKTSQPHISRIEHGLSGPKEALRAEAIATAYRLNEEQREKWFMALFGFVPEQPSLRGILDSRESADRLSETNLSTRINLDALKNLLPRTREVLNEELGPVILPPAPSPTDDKLIVPPSDAEVATQLMAVGYQFGRVGAWAEGAQVFLAAERLFGKGSPRAIRAATQAIQLFLNLGDHGQMKAHLDRVHAEHHMAIGHEARVELLRLEGWLAFDEGHLEQSQQRFESALTIAQEAGTIRLEEGVVHFLGRVRAELATRAPTQQKAEALWGSAGTLLDRALRSHQRNAPDIDVGFDLIRLAELARARGQFDNAKRLRARAREAFGWNEAVLHVELEEARLTLENGQYGVAGRKAQNALKGWADLRFAKGMAMALRILGQVAHRRGRALRAVQFLVAALCIHSANESVVTELWKETESALEDAHRFAYRPMDELIQDIRELAETRQEPFSYVERLAMDRTAQVDAILTRLATLGEAIASRS